MVFLVGSVQRTHCQPSKLVTVMQHSLKQKLSAGVMVGLQGMPVVTYGDHWRGSLIRCFSVCHHHRLQGEDGREFSPIYRPSWAVLGAFIGDFRVQVLHLWCTYGAPARELSMQSGWPAGRCQGNRWERSGLVAGRRTIAVRLSGTSTRGVNQADAVGTPRCTSRAHKNSSSLLTLLRVPRSFVAPQSFAFVSCAYFAQRAGRVDHPEARHPPFVRQTRPHFAQWSRQIRSSQAGHFTKNSRRQSSTTYGLRSCSSA